MTGPQERTPGEVGTGQALKGTDNSAILTDIDAERKADACRVALAALAGIALHKLADGRWLATRWNLTRELDADEVDSWLARVGVKL
jgi:hypothetical protein